MSAFQIISRSFHHTSTFQKGSAIRTGFRWRGGQRRTSETILSWNLDFWRRYCWVRNEQCNNNNGTFFKMKGPFSLCFDHWNRLYCTFHLSLLLSFLLLLLILLSLLSITRSLKLSYGQSIVIATKPNKQKSTNNNLETWPFDVNQSKIWLNFWT